MRTYDPSSIVDGEIEYLAEAHETIVFESQGKLDGWADINGLRAVVGRNDNDILTSIDPYQLPHTGNIEARDLYIQRPTTITVPQPALDIRAIEHHAIQDTLLAAFPTTASAVREFILRHRSAAGWTSVPRGGEPWRRWQRPGRTAIPIPPPIMPMVVISLNCP